MKTYRNQLDSDGVFGYNESYHFKVNLNIFAGRASDD